MGLVYEKIMKMELDFTSEEISEKRLENELIEKKVANTSKIYNQLKILQNELWKKHIKDKYQKYKCFRTNSHLVYINNEGIYFFFKIS